MMIKQSTERQNHVRRKKKDKEKEQKNEQRSKINEIDVVNYKSNTNRRRCWVFSSDDDFWITPYLCCNIIRLAAANCYLIFFFFFGLSLFDPMAFNLIFPLFTNKFMDFFFCLMNHYIFLNFFVFWLVTIFSGVVL